MHLNVGYTMIDESLLKSNVLGRDGFTWWIGRVAHPDFWKKENETVSYTHLTLPTKRIV